MKKYVSNIVMVDRPLSIKDCAAKVINLMDAQKQSVTKAAKDASPPRPAKKMAPSKPAKPTSTLRRKTS